MVERPFLVDFNSVFSLPHHEDTYLYPSFQGNMSDNDTARLGLDFQRMLRINHMVYIAARYVMSVQSHARTAHNTTATHISKDATSTRNSRPLDPYTLVLFLQTPAAIRPTH